MFYRTINTYLLLFVLYYSREQISGPDPRTRPPKLNPRKRADPKTRFECQTRSPGPIPRIILEDQISQPDSRTRPQDQTPSTRPQESDLLFVGCPSHHHHYHHPSVRLLLFPDGAIRSRLEEVDRPLPPASQTANAPVSHSQSDNIPAR